MSLTELEQDILAEGKKLEAVAKAEVLKLRQSALVKELEKIEKALAALVSAPAKPAAKPKAPAAKP